MKTIEDRAHEYFLETMRFIRENNIAHDFDEIVKESFDYAEAMQAEAEKRKAAPNADPMRKVREAEWQPDWSQAPDTATHWTMRQDGECLWWKGKPLFDGSCFYDAVGICHTVGYAPSFNYQGDWKDSLRKRP